MQKTPTPPWFRPAPMILCVLIVLLLQLLVGCKSPSLPLQPAPVKAVQPLALPAYARQPTTPSECSSTCLLELTRERESWRILLTGEALPAKPASAATTPSTSR